MFCNLGAAPVIRAGHNGITIDLNHHMIVGNGAGVGIDDQGFHSTVVIGRANGDAPETGASAYRSA